MATRPPVYIIGLTGLKRAGKDTVAATLAKIGYKHVAFAHWLKQACASVFDLSEAQLHGSDADKETIDARWGVSARTLLQAVGTELFRDALPRVLPQLACRGETLWCYRMRMWLNALPPSTFVVISDLRFPDEAALVHELGGVVVRVVRPGGTGTGGTDTHASECGQAAIKADIHLLNDGTLADLEARTYAIAVALAEADP